MEAYLKFETSFSRTLVVPLKYDESEKYIYHCGTRDSDEVTISITAKGPLDANGFVIDNGQLDKIRPILAGIPKISISCEQLALAVMEHVFSLRIDLTSVTVTVSGDIPGGATITGHSQGHGSARSLLESIPPRPAIYNNTTRKYVYTDSFYPSPSKR